MTATASDQFTSVLGSSRGVGAMGAEDSAALNPFAVDHDILTGLLKGYENMATPRSAAMMMRRIRMLAAAITAPDGATVTAVPGDEVETIHLAVFPAGGTTPGVISPPVPYADLLDGIHPEADGLEGHEPLLTNVAAVANTTARRQ